MTDQIAKIQRIARVAQAFTPGAPIDDLDLFAGRIPQIQDVVSAVVQKGTHVALYGERGVGKTSLANILEAIFGVPDLPRYRAIRINCDSEEVNSFPVLWGNVYRELAIDGPWNPRPEDVRQALAVLDDPALIILDELDRLRDDEALTLLADTIKTLSDHTIESKVVLVGVASSIDELIGEHESIARALVKVHMPRMALSELRELLDKACRKAGLSADQGAVDRITVLSQGLPHFTHLLGLHAGQRAVQEDRSEILPGDVTATIPDAVRKHVVETDYLRATHSAHTDSLYRPVLLACALAAKDQFGFFAAGAIRGPLEVIAGRRIEIPQFARHLSEFLRDDRGAPLRRQGVKHRYLYRFRDPILQTYVVLDGLASGLLAEERLSQMEGWQAPPQQDLGTMPEPLF